MAIDLKHALAVGGIAVVALGAGIGIARATGDEEQGKPPATPATSQAELPSVPDAAPVKVTDAGRRRRAPGAPGGRPPAQRSGRRRHSQRDPEPEQPEFDARAEPEPDRRSSCRDRRAGHAPGEHSAAGAHPGRRGRYGRRRAVSRVHNRSRPT